MNSRIEGPTAAHAAPSLGSGLSESLRSQAGRLHGESVRSLPPGGSVLGDAAEEVSMLFAEKAERQRHEDRVVKSAGRPSLAGIEQISEYLDRAHKEGGKEGSKEANQQALSRMAQRLLDAGGENLYALARGNPRYQQPTEQFLLFQFTREKALAEGQGPEVLQRLDDAIADLDLLYGDQIQANLLTIEPASEYAQTTQEVTHFQNSLQTVLGAPSIAQALKEVLQMAGQSGQRLDSALNQLMKALGACLGTGLASQERLLEVVVTDLFHLKTMNTLLESCRELVRTLPQRNPPVRGAKGAKGKKDGSTAANEEDEDAPSRPPGSAHGSRH